MEIIKMEDCFVDLLIDMSDYFKISYAFFSFF